MDITIESKIKQHIITFSVVQKQIVKVEKFRSSTQAIENYNLSPIQKFDIFSKTNTRLYFDDGKTITLFNNDFICVEGDSIEILIGRYLSKPYLYYINNTTNNSIAQIDNPRNILNNEIKLFCPDQLLKSSALLLVALLITIFTFIQIGKVFVIAALILCFPLYYVSVLKLINTLKKVCSKDYVLITKKAEKKYYKDINQVIDTFTKRSVQTRT